MVKTGLACQFSFGLVGAAVFFAARLGVDISDFRHFIRLLLFAVVAAIGDVPKPGGATVAAAAVHAEADPRSTATDSRCSAANARPVDAGSEFVRSVDMVQWLGQVKSQFGLVRDEMQAASLRTDGYPGPDIDLCGAVRPSRYRS